VVLLTPHNTLLSSVSAEILKEIVVPVPSSFFTILKIDIFISDIDLSFPTKNIGPDILLLKACIFAL